MSTKSPPPAFSRGPYSIVVRLVSMAIFGFETQIPILLENSLPFGLSLASTPFGSVPAVTTTCATSVEDVAHVDDVAVRLQRAFFIGTPKIGQTRSPKMVG